MEQPNFPSADEESKKAREFLQTFEFNGSLTYMEQLREIANRERKVLEIYLDDIRDDDFARNVRRNTTRYVHMFEECADQLLPKNRNRGMPAFPDIFDNLYKQREEEFREVREHGILEGLGTDAMPEEESTDLPRSLIRRFEVNILPSVSEPVRKLREVLAQDIGHLLKVKGMVTRISDVKPLASVVAYTCEVCGSTLFGEINAPQFMPISTCPSERCKTNKSAGKIVMQTRGTKFVKYQELRVQELPDQVPVGRIPRCMTVHCRGECTRKCGPGDIITISGVFMTVRYTGFRAIKAGLQSDTYLEATNIEKHKQNYNDLEVDSTTERQVREVAQDPDPYSRLAAAIAPEIYGHEDVKKALLLQLVGGVTKVLPDGMKIRGDLNICLMGDPGTAKSQLLKYIATISPRGVYTTGKGSSGVGLTAAVVKDTVTGDMSLEGGALVMADRGICCIDEFDKMDESDRTAIHEVMEQQTISIAKAGITTTLNARAAVLAAANPLYGRYNTNRSISDNVDLPNSLLSRFDLMFLILDRADVDRDLALSRHVLHVHKYKKSFASAAEELNGRQGSMSTLVIKKYIAAARQVEPSVSPDVAPYIVEAYVALRSQRTDLRAGKQFAKSDNSDQTTMTARQLLSILRLSQALARLRLSDTVTNQDVDEAIRLTHSSKSSLLDHVNKTANVDVNSSIFDILRDHSAQQNSSEVEYGQVEAMVLMKGFTVMQLSACLQEYQFLNVLTVDENRTTITIY